MEFAIFDHLDHSGAALSDYYEDRLRLTELYDRSGFYAYHIAEHHGTPLGLAPSPTVFLSSVAQRTKRLRFGPLVYLLPLYEPLRLLEEICMLDQISRGRLEIGVGRGVSPHELALYGLTPNSAEARFDEVIEILVRGLTSETLDFHGEFYRYDGVPILVRPMQRPHPPFWYGTLRPESAMWAANRSMNIVAGNGPAAEVKAIVDAYRSGWSQGQGKAAEIPKIGLMRQIVIGETDAEARHIARRAYRRWRDSFTSLWRLRQDEFADKLVPAEFDALEARGEAVAGSIETVSEVLSRDLACSQANYLVCRFAFGDLSYAEVARSVALFAERIMPRLKSGENAGWAS